MARAVVIPTARPTFAVDAAKERADAARRLVAELGAGAGVEVTGPTELVMTPEDTSAAAAYAPADADLVVNVCASFSDAAPALTLYRDLDRPVLLWAFREPGPVGDRLWLNSLCGANLFAHALVTRAEGSARLLYGDPEEPEVRAAVADALAGSLPPAPELPQRQRERAETADVAARLERLRGARIGLIGDAPDGFTPCEYDRDLMRDLFGVEVEQVAVDSAFERIAAVGTDARDAEYADALGHAMITDHDGRGWLLVDRRVAAEARRQLGAQTVWFQRLQAEYLLRSAARGDTLDQVASRAGIDAAGLRDTVAAHDAAAREGAEDPAGKPAEFVRTLDSPPYMLLDVSIRPSVAYPCPVLTLGGLVVDEGSGQVRRPDGTGVAGLYAAGRTAVGLCSNSYVSGLSLADCVFSGRRAGTHAAHNRVPDDDLASEREDLRGVDRK